MPNPHPTPKVRKSPTGDELLPPGFARRPDGRLRLRWTPPGAPRREVYGWSVDECNAKRYGTPRAIRRAPASITTGEYLEAWLRGLTGRPNSNATHRHNVERYLLPIFGSAPLTELDREVIRAGFAVIRAMPARGGGVLAPRTVSLIFATLRRALNVAVEDGRLPANPAARLNPNGTTGAGARGARVGVELRIPTDAELRRVLPHLEPIDRALFELSVLTGLRQSEALGLGWDAFAQAGVVRVTRALRRTDRELDDPKSSTSARFVPLSPSYTPVLAAVRQAQRLARIAAGEAWDNPHELVFTDATGGALVGSSLSHRLTAACRAAGVAPFRWHDLRHAYASGSINAGVPIALVSKYLGHANVAITSEVYHHIATGDDHSAVIRATEAMLGR
jgi:integrase